MTRPRCVLCEGLRDVTPRQVAVTGGQLDMPVCRWCWEKYGPAAHIKGQALGPWSLDGLAYDFDDAEADQ